jgi:predicted acylesterase/phospholipase RssA
MIFLHHQLSGPTRMSSSSETEPPRVLAFPEPHPEFIRAAVVAIQGGGIFGLCTLGQLSAVFDAGISPIALSGTSAGAVVATLVWAGYTPKDVRDMFVLLALDAGHHPDRPAPRENLLHLLGDSGGSPSSYPYQRFRSLADSVDGHLRQFARFAEEAIKHSGWQLWWRVGLIRRVEFVAALLAALLVAIVGYAMWRWGGYSPHLVPSFVVLAWVTVAGVVCHRILALLQSIWKIGWSVLAHPWPHRGFFSGERFEVFICEKLRDSPRLRPFRAELDGNPLTFGRITELRNAHPDDPQLDLVPLILTATNLDNRELVLIASYDETFADYEVAKAVRASAGFPVFFQPVAVSSGAHAGSHVDGGVIANYPAWVFSRRLRAGLSETEEYHDLATRPWLNIGLRVAAGPSARSASSPGGFLRAMFDLARGQIRDQLEKALSAPLPRTLTIEQPNDRTGAPVNFLDIHELNRNTIHTMFGLGHEVAAERLRGMSFVLPTEGDAIRGPLERLVQKINLVLGQVNNDFLDLRANVFVPSYDGLALRYAFNMDRDGDRHIVLSGNKGLTGTCYYQRRPYLCNLEVIRGWALIEADPKATQLGMTPAEHLSVREDRTWLINVPIFDPQDSWFLDELPIGPAPEADTVWTELPTDRDGAVLGVLNVDGVIPYNHLNLPEDPKECLTDPRISCIVPLLWSCSIEIARCLSLAFARRG